MAISIGALVFWDAGQPALGGSNIRVYQLASPIVIAILIGEYRRLRRTLQLFRGSTDDHTLLGFLLGIALYTILTVLSLAWSISPSNTAVAAIGQSALLALSVSYGLLVASGLIRIRQLLAGLAVVAGVGSLLALVQFMAGLAGIQWGVVRGSSGVPWPRPLGLMSEPDWAALVAILCICLSVWLRAVTDDQFWTLLAVVGLAVAVIAAARAAWVAGIVALGLWILVMRRRWLAARTLGVVLALVAVLVAVTMVTSPQLLQRLDPRALIGSTTAVDNGSVSSRLGVLRLIANDGTRYLPLGAGAGSLAKLTAERHVLSKYAGGGELNAGRGSTNIFATSWFDLGPLGLVALGLVLFNLAILTWGQRGHDGGLSIVIATTLLVDFQFNNGIRFGFVWLLIGLLLGEVAARHLRDSDPLSTGKLEMALDKNRPSGRRGDRAKLTVRPHAARAR